MDWIFGTLCLILLFILWLINFLTVKNSNTQILEKMEKMYSKIESAKVLMPINNVGTKTDCTTILPMPIGSEMCLHSMEVLTNQVIRAPHEEKAIIILQCTKCGVIDKTVSVTTPPPVPKQSKSECRHNWVKEKAITLSSAFEQMEELLKSPGKTAQKSFEPSEAPSWMFAKKHIKERVCSQCGEIDRVVASNFEVDEVE